MVKIGLQISANLDSVDELKTSHPNYSFVVKVKCTNCGEESQKWHDFMESEKTAEDSRNPAGFNFAIRCKLCSRDNSLDVLEGSNASYTADDSGNFKTIVVFDARGIEPTEFSPQKGWIVKAAEGGQTFEEVDFSEDDWVEYDQKNKTSIGVYEFRSQFIKLKK